MLSNEQEYLNIVERSVDLMERRVDQVDQAYGGTKLKKLFSSFVVSCRMLCTVTHSSSLLLGNSPQSQTRQRSRPNWTGNRLISLRKLKTTSLSHAAASFVTVLVCSR